MFQLPVFGPNLFVLEREITAAGSKDAYVFPSTFDGTTMSENSHKTTAGHADHCNWRGDSPEPELDDIVHDEEIHGPRLPNEVCSWHGDPPEPELDDLAHDSRNKQSPRLSPKSRAASDTGPQLVHTELKLLANPSKPESSKEHKKNSKSPKVKDSAHKNQKNDVHSGKKARKTPQAGWFGSEIIYDIPGSLTLNLSDNQLLSSEERGEQILEDLKENLQEQLSQGFHQAFNAFENIIKSSNPQPASDRPGNMEPSKGQKPPTKEEDIPPEPTRHPPIPTIDEPRPAKGKKSKEDKERAKREKEEAKRAEKERKANEKEEKKRIKREKEEAKKGRSRKSKEKKKEKGTDSLAGPSAGAVGSHAHPGCQICQNPEDENTLNFMRELLESAQDLPSFNDLVNAAKKFLGAKETAESLPLQEANEVASWNEEELIEHIAAHIDKHMHKYFDLDSPRGEFPAAGKAPPRKAAVPAKEAESRDNDCPVSHGLDGNRDWATTIMQSHMHRSLEPISTSDVALARCPSHTCSPSGIPMSRSVSPWCEHLGFKIDDPAPSYPKRNSSWLRRGFNSSPTRLRSVVTTPCPHASSCSHRPYLKPALYACVPVSLVPALCLETSCCGHSSCHYPSPIMTPSSVPHTPAYPLFNFQPHSIAETIPGTPRRSLSANE
ncbi:hypothetical protein M434DRAFT_30989 [Hypoxylon sp. CO27-5]|nr:hypothetical protein M434DRAFT_30989 [Hypoxylon sp. CO27-5]